MSREIKELRNKGKIPDDFAGKKYGYQSFSELMTVIDNEVPDQERLDAIKAMFYAVNKVNAEDSQRIVAYQLFQIAKKLTSGQLLYLKGCYAIYTAREFQNGGPAIASHQWFSKIGNKLGHSVSALLNLDDLALIKLGLLSPRVFDESSINQSDAHMTDLGIKFCEDIQTYHLEAREES